MRRAVHCIFVIAPFVAIPEKDCYKRRNEKDAVSIPNSTHNTQQKMLKIGHRGAKGHVAENTIASFQKAIDLGCDGVELDVHICQSGEVVVIHDDSIDRTTTAKGSVKDLNFSELHQHQIPSLLSVLDLINNRICVNIEIKSADCAQKILDITDYYIRKKNWNTNNFIISSFNWTILSAIYQGNPKLKIAVLTADSIEKAVNFAKKINAFAINPYYELLNQDNVTLMHQNGFKIFAWTVNELSAIEKMKCLLIDAIISDYPERI